MKTSTSSDCHSAPEPSGPLNYLPVLDIPSRTPAGFQAVQAGRTTVELVRAALSASANISPDTFIAIPIPLPRLRDADIRTTLREHGSLAGVVLDITDFSPTLSRLTESAIDQARNAGALISVGGREAAQPELGSIFRLRPSIVRLGRAWIIDIDQSPTRRSAVEVIVRLAAQLDARILVESVASGAELDALAELEVPLAQGPFIGGPQPWECHS